MRYLWLVCVLIAGCGGSVAPSTTDGTKGGSDAFRVEETPVFTPGRKKRVVFMGDSTTYGWIRSAWFNQMVGQGHFINKGVGGNKTIHMRERFQRDVIDLKPDVVIILGGANDYTCCPEYDQQAIANLSAMYEMAIAANIKVVAATIMPVRTYPSNTQNYSLYNKNTLIKQYVAQHPEITLLDYWEVVLDPQVNELRAIYAVDSVHLSEEGYRALTPITDVALRPYWIPD